jgi:hypothetical protein
MNRTIERSPARCTREPCERRPRDAWFDVFQVLQIAEEVERKAARFYLQAARRFADGECRDLCYSLAACRIRHRHAWVRLQRVYAEGTREGEPGGPVDTPRRRFCVGKPQSAFVGREIPRIPPEGGDYVLSRPEVMAGLTCFAAFPVSPGGITGRETREQLLRDAIRRARDLMIFYEGLKGFAGSPDGRRAIDHVLREEGRCLGVLSRHLERKPSPHRMGQTPGPQGQSAGRAIPRERTSHF